MAPKIKMPKMPKMPKTGFLAMPAVRVLIVVVLVVIIAVALIRAGFLPAKYSLSLKGSLGGDVKPQVGGLAFPMSGEAAGSVGVGYEMVGEAFMNAMGRRENFENAEGDMKVVLYHRKNCPHCVAMKEEWVKFVGDMKKMHPEIVVVDFDGDTEEGRKNFPEDISGVPTVRMYKGKEMMEYNGDRKASAMMDFVHKNL